MKLKPSEMYFTVDTIGNRFDVDSEHGDVLIGQTLDDLCEGTCRVQDIPNIEVFWKDERFWSTNNRRLWVFRQLERLNMLSGHHIEVCVVPEMDNFVPPDVYGGKEVKVAGEPGGEWCSKTLGHYGFKLDVTGDLPDKYDTGSFGENYMSTFAEVNLEPGTFSKSLYPQSVRASRRRKFPEQTDDDVTDHFPSDEDGFSDGEDDHASKQPRQIIYENIDNSGFEMFSVKAGLVYVLFLAIIAYMYQ